MGTDTNTGSHLTDAMRAVAGGASVLTPETARDLLVRAADAIDAQAGRIVRLEKSLEQALLNAKDK